MPQFVRAPQNMYLEFAFRMARDQVLTVLLQSQLWSEEFPRCLKSVEILGMLQARN